MQRVREGHYLVSDGAWGTFLQAKGNYGILTIPRR